MTRTVKSKRRRLRSRLPAAPRGVALWRSVADELERAIGNGAYAAGARLPGEKEIADRFRVNRHTVRRALADLAGRGLVRAERGSGTYVEATRIPYPIRSRTRFSEIIGGIGREAGGRLIEANEEVAHRDVARKLAIEPGARVIRLELLRHADKVPLCVGTSWLPAGRFPDLPRIYAEEHSMTRTLARFGLPDYRRAVTHVTAALADLTDALRLELRPGSPILVVDSVDSDEAGRPILTTHARFAAERVELLIDG